jgi:hypothetical protein
LPGQFSHPALPSQPTLSERATAEAGCPNQAPSRIRLVPQLEAIQETGPRLASAEGCFRVSVQFSDVRWVGMEHVESRNPSCLTLWP